MSAPGRQVWRRPPHFVMPRSKLLRPFGRRLQPQGSLDNGCGLIRPRRSHGGSIPVKTTHEHQAVKLTIIRDVGVRHFPGNERDEVFGELVFRRRRGNYAAYCEDAPQSHTLLDLFVFGRRAICSSPPPIVQPGREASWKRKLNSLQMSVISPRYQSTLHNHPSD